MGACLDGVVLCGQTEGVESHRMQDVVAVHPEVAAVDVRGGVALGVSYMKAGSRRIGEHVEDVGPFLLGEGGVFGYGKGLVLCPVLLPFRLCFCKWIAAHG